MNAPSQQQPGGTGPERGAPLGLVCTDVSMRYGKTHALDGLCLTVEPGVALGLVGRNGAGKSTLFRCIIGAERPDSGSVQCAPELPRTAFLARTGFVPDALSAYDWMRVGGAIDYVAAVQPRFDAAWSAELVELLRLDRSVKIRALSRGMQARLAFVLGLSHRPDLVLLDEPLLGVDAVSHDTVLEVLARMRSVQGCTMLIASHQLSDLARLTDRIALLDRGRIVEQIATDELVQRTKRVVVRPSPTSGWSPPPQAILCRARDGATALTVRDFDDAVRESLRASTAGAHVDVIDLSIAEACADRLRALEVQS
ncbi:MAG: ABC transporter ATP-binding protein [Phycisphaerae bacterium]|nr:ABC transporter ATP-binding protein [Phycisphaerae bacterium]